MNETNKQEQSVNTMTESRAVLVSKKGNFCTITLNRPDVLNSFTEQLSSELLAELNAAGNDPEIRAVILTGAGRGFCAGQDLKEILATPDNPNPLGKTHDQIVREHYNPVIKAIRNLPKPVICAVNGVAAGAGANLALACDFVIAGNKSSFIQSFSKIGLISDSGGTWILPRLVGMARAAELMMLGEKVSAEDAKQMGLIYKVVEAESLVEASEQFAAKLAAMPTKSFAYTKTLLNKSFEHSLDEQLEMEAHYQGKAGTSHDYNEGVQAFMEKRKPNYKGE